MIRSEEFTKALQSRGIQFFTGVPCSYFKHVITHVTQHPGITYLAAANEGAALAAASGAFLAGQGAVVMIQNSGLGNLINPLTSLSMIYKIPVLLLISGRAYGFEDEPQHEIMGRVMGKMVGTLGISCQDLPQDETWRESLNRGIDQMRELQMPVVFFVRKNTFAPAQTTEAKPAAPQFSMKRIEAIAILKEILPEDCAVFATTGKISREIFSVFDRPGNFYMQGSMGHAPALALGYALANPEKRVAVIDGDGAFLMHMGTGSSIGHYAPKNLVHILLDNESYETTGDQDTTSATTDFEMIARAAGYKRTAKAVTSEELTRSAELARSAQGPVFLWVKINRLETTGIPRITTKYTADQITDNFIRFSKDRIIHSRLDS